MGLERFRVLRDVWVCYRALWGLITAVHHELARFYRLRKIKCTTVMSYEFRVCSS